MRELSSDSPIDAVITWVDGKDPAHQAKLDAHFGSDIHQRPRAADATRFYDSGEINLCVLSLLKFAPWLRKIFIVTDEQVPKICSLLADVGGGDKVQVVDHREIFRDYELYLPTFNSMSIATMLWRVPGLAENFLYLNDDFVLIQPMNPEHFFQQDNVVVRGRWRTSSSSQVSRKTYQFIKQLFNHKQSAANQRTSHRKNVETAATLLGFERKYFDLPHNPHSCKKSLLQEYYETFPDVFRRNVSFKLRSNQQYCDESLMAHLAIKRGKAIVDNRSKTLHLKPGEQSIGRVRAKLATADADADYKFACVQSMEKSSDACQAMIWNWLAGRIGCSDLFTAPGDATQSNVVHFRVDRRERLRYLGIAEPNGVDEAAPAPISLSSIPSKI